MVRKLDMMRHRCHDGWGKLLDCAVQHAGCASVAVLFASSRERVRSQTPPLIRSAGEDRVGECSLVTDDDGAEIVTKGIAFTYKLLVAYQ